MMKSSRDGRSNNKDMEKREHKNNEIGDGVMSGGEVVLCEALPFLDAVSIVDKKMVCRQWKEKCDVAINSKGRQRKKQFVANKELRDAVVRYCEGNHDDIEKIAEEYGYPIGKWDVSRVQDFSYVFWNLEQFDEDVDAWDVGNATSMRSTFARAKSFNRGLSGWDVSNVKDMRGMFAEAYNFNGDVSTWDTSSVIGMSQMFASAWEFNGDISRWDTSRVTKMREMFKSAEAFNGNLSAWDTSRVTDMNRMFHNAYVFNGDVSAWNTSRVRDTRYMFHCHSIFVRTPLAHFSSAFFLVYMCCYEKNSNCYTVKDYVLLAMATVLIVSVHNEKIEKLKELFGITSTMRWRFR